MVTNFKLFENYKGNIIHLLTFYRYGSKKGMFGNWATTDKDMYAHFKDKGVHTFKFGVRDNLMRFTIDEEATVYTEYVYNRWMDDEEFDKIKENFDDEEWLLMDAITAIGAKSEGKDGVIFKNPNDVHAIDLRDHTLEELQENYKKLLAGDY